MKYQIEVDVVATAYIEVEADDEIEAMDMANNQVACMQVRELKNWENTASVKKVTECCENCCDELSPEDIHEYKGIKLCNNCIEWAKEEPENFNFIFKGKIKS